LAGSRSYAKQIAPEQKDEIAALVNIECLGLSPTAIWLSRADPQLARFARFVAANAKMPLPAINVEKIGTDDAASFARLRIPSITFHSVTQPTLQILHSNRDNFKAVIEDEYYDSYRFLALYLALIDQRLEGKR
jgi:Iap family predicted aminopeptidase